jgi:integrase
MLTRMQARKINENFRLRQRSDGIWEVAWTDLESGKPRRKSAGTRDEETACVQLAQIAADARAPKAPPAPTIRWIVDRYIEAVERRKPDRNHAPLKASLRPVKERLGDLRWDQLTQDEVDSYVEWRLTNERWAGDGKARQNPVGTISRSTAQKDLRMLRTALNDALARRFIPHEVKFRINVTAAASKDVWLTKAEVRRMLDVCEPRETERGEDGKVTARRRNRDHLYAFILISTATAARKEAVLSLGWDQVYIPRPEDMPEDVRLMDIETMTVNGNAYIDFGDGHGNKRRPTMPIGKNWLLMNYLVFGGDKEQPYVISYRGKSVKDIKKGLAKVVDEAGMKKKVTPHTLKHTAITWMVQSGMKLTTISELTNTSEKILRSVYSHHRPDYQAELGDALAL